MEGDDEASSSNVTPTKPHFFKPLLPGFHQGLLIPVAFYKHYLNDHGKSNNCDIAVFRTILGEWKVKIKDWRFEEDGWRDFAQHYDLHVGDMVVFRYEGGLVFDVIVFDPTACEKCYDHPQTVILDVKEEISLEHPTNNLQGSKDHATRKLKVKKESMKLKSPASKCLHVKKESLKLSAETSNCFISTMTEASIKYSYLCIPNHFLRLHSLEDFSEMTIKDPKQRLWEVYLTHNNFQSASRIRMGWKEVVVANNLKQGQNIKLELVEREKSLMMILSVCGGPKGGTV